MTLEASRLSLQLIHGDCRDILPTLEKEHADLVITDPPYFLAGLDNKWQKGSTNAPRATGSIGGLPVGMKFDPQQGKNLHEFIRHTATMLFPLMKPGAFALFFSQPRLAHRMAIGLEEGGFHIRDTWAWHFTQQAQFKAFSLDHFIDKMDLPQDKKRHMKEQLHGRKTPQLRPQFESMILAQKPRQGSFLNNWQRYHVGLINPKASLDGKTPCTVMSVEKEKKQDFNHHVTVKPLRLLCHLIELLSLPHQHILDPFVGSGTTLLAAQKTGRHCLGIDIDERYIAIAKRRVHGLKQS